MMIKSSLQLTFFVCTNLHICGVSQKRKNLWGVFDYFTVILDLWNTEIFQRLNPAFCLGGWVGGGVGARYQPQPPPKVRANST